MNSRDIFPVLILTIMAMLMVYVPRWLSLKWRVVGGAVLFIVGWGGILLGLRSSDNPYFQRESVAYVWVVGFTACALVSAILLLSAAIEWLRSGSSRKRR